jgi:hypothetical protein
MGRNAAAALTAGRRFEKVPTVCVVSRSGGGFDPRVMSDRGGAGSRLIGTSVFPKASRQPAIKRGVEAMSCHGTDRDAAWQR